MSGVTLPTPNPLYPSTSSEKPQLLCIDFTDDPTGSLGAQLVNFDKVRFPVNNKSLLRSIVGLSRLLLVVGSQRVILCDDLATRHA